MKILIVDDSKEKADDIRKFVSECCNADDEILVAETSNDARAILRDREIDLLILDVILPRFRGGRHNPERELICCTKFWTATYT